MNATAASNVAVPVTLAAEALKRKVVTPFRVWLLFRYLRSQDKSDCGWLPKSKALGQLESWGFSQASCYRVLKQGQKLFWRTMFYEKVGEVVELVSATKLAQAWGLTYLAPRRTYVPLQELLPTEPTVEEPSPKGGTRVGRARAVLFLATLAGVKTPKIRTYRNGKVRALKPKPSHPLARATLRAKTGVPERSQRRYDRVRGQDRKLLVRRGRPNYATTLVEATPDWLGGSAHIPSRRFYCETLEVTGNCAGVVARRLGHSYETTFRQTGWGIARAFNESMRPQWCARLDADTGKRSLHPIERTYFDSELVMARAVARHEEGLADAPRFLVPVSARLRPWAREWAVFGVSMS